MPQYQLIKEEIEKYHTPNTGGIGELSRCRPLFLPGSEVGILADKDG